MQEYVSWQNSLLSADEMAAGRFVEIPALHQTALFRREAVDAVLARSGGCYRDGPRRRDGRAGGEEEVGDELDTPVDLWWWLEFFDAGKRCGKLGGEPLFGWRQHPRQHTRTHGRLALPNLRRIKAHFLLRGPARGASELQVWSTGETLRGWVEDMRHALASRGAATAAEAAVRGAPPPTVDVVAVEYKPGAPPPTQWRGRRPNHKRKAPSEDAAAGGGPEGGSGSGGAPPSVVRLFAFGKVKARNKVRAAIRDWDEALDVFVA